MTVLASLACVIDATGCHAPAFGDIQDTLVAGFQTIYGPDIVISNDSQDGQWIGVLASAINDCNAATVAAYNSYSPATAQGTGLSSVVKINGIARNIPANSAVDVTLVGDVGLTITNGIVSDVDRLHQWLLPASVTIPISGSIVVTASAADAGAIAAGVGTINTIVTPTRGWNSVTNASAASVGQPVETDAALRARQAISTAQPASASDDALVGAVSALAGVARLKLFKNETNATDANGIPAFNIAMVVEGGVSADIAAAIAARKAPGVPTYGTTSQTVFSAVGIPSIINFFRPTQAVISVAISITSLPGYTTSVGTEIKAAVAAYINALPIGSPVYLTRLYLPANLSGQADGSFFDITALTIARSPASPTSANVILAFNEVPICDPAVNIALTVI